MTSSSFAAGAPDGALRLTDWGLIQAQGADAASFLHGQLTQSMQDLPRDRARLAGYCSAKGRLLASFVAWRTDAEGVALACSADLLPATLKRLSMFVLRARCRLTDATAQTALWGLAGPSAAAWLGDAAAQAPAWRAGTGPEGGTWIRLPDAPSPTGGPGGGVDVPRWLWAAAADGPSPALPALAAGRWAALEVGSGVPRIVAATADHFVPQMVNLEVVGGVDFRKGCYPGQEVVARSQYRGTLKRRMVKVRASGPLAPGAEVFHPSDPGQPAGEVVLAAPAADGAWTALVEVKLALLASGLNFSSVGVDMGVEDLPYALPTEPA